MDTRNLILVYYEGAYRIAQYGQWDGYPSGQGVKILAFIADPTRLTALKKALDNNLAYFPTKEQFERLEGKPLEEVPSLSRDTAAGILDLVANAAEPVPLVDETEFMADTLFCEWAYVVDLDEEVFEVYSSWENLQAQESDRFEAANPMVGRWAFAELPSEDTFLASLQRERSDGAIEHTSSGCRYRSHCPHMIETC